MSWWRQYVRARTKPMHPEYAMKMKKSLSIVYAVAAWHAFALLVYLTVKRNYPESVEDKEHPSKYYSKILGASDAKVVKYSGFTKVDEYDLKGIDDSEHIPWFRRWKEQKDKEQQEREALERKKLESFNLLDEETNSL